MPEPLNFMSLSVTLATKQESLAAIESATSERPVRIATLNPEFVVAAERNVEFKAALTRMTHCVIDGSGLFFALKLAQWLKRGPDHVEFYPGADLAEDLFRRHQHGEKRFFLLGGPPGLAQESAKALKGKYPELKIVGATDGGRVSTESVQIREELAEEIRTAKPDILLVGFGAPKQELWIDAAIPLGVPVMIGVGGTFGFYNNKRRAPIWMRSLHLEWLFRALTERGHWKRIITATIVFPFQALVWLLNTKGERGNERK